MDLAVGVIIGAAFGKIVDSLVGDIIMPLVGMIVGGLDFSNYFIPLAGQTATTLAEAKKALALGGGGAAATSADEEVGGVKFSGQVLDGLDPKELRGLLDQAKGRLGSGVAVIVAVNDGKASIAAAVTDDLTGKVSAVDLVRAGVEALGGKGGGGRADMAQGGGPDGSKAAEAIAAVKGVLAG